MTLEEEPKEIPDSELAVAATYFWITDAQMAHILLSSEAIDSVIQDSGIVEANPFLANATGGIKLCVRRSDLERAQQLLELAAQKNSEQWVATCPNCESTDITENRLNPVIIILSILTLGFFFVAFYRPHRCTSCGYRWR